MYFDERDMMMTEGLDIEAGREARPNNTTALIPTQPIEVKTQQHYVCQPPTHPSHGHSHAIHPHSSHHHIPNTMALNMSKSGGEIGDFFFTSMVPNYAQVLFLHSTLARSDNLRNEKR